MNKELMFSSNTPEWETPQDLFDRLDALYHFDLDAAATPENAKCARFFTKEDNGLMQMWGGIACGAILHTAARSAHGSTRHTRRRGHRERWLSCFYRRGQTRLGFTTIAGTAT